MKIDPGLKPVTLPPSVENRPAEPHPNKHAATERAHVSLSPRASQLVQLETQLAAIPVVDRARVDSIKEAIAAGQYAINTANIADSLIGSAKEVLYVRK